MEENQYEQRWRSIPNPFSNIRDANDVITGNVSGRKADIIELVMGGQSAVILAGAPRIGKSTLIRYLQRPVGHEWSWRDELADEVSPPFLDTIHFVQIDLAHIAGIGDLKELRNQFIVECSIALHQVYGRTTQTTHDIKSIRSLLREIRLQQPGGRCFVMLDAIERLAFSDIQPPSSAQEQGIAILDRAGIMRMLVDLIDEFPNFGAIIAIESLPLPSMDDQFIHVSADLARFTTTTLQTFTLQDAKAFLQQHPESFGMEWARRFRESGKHTIFSEEEQAWLLKQAGTHPYILQQYCLYTFHLKQDDIHEASYELQERYKRQLIEYINGRLSTFISGVWNRLQKALDKSSQEAKENFSTFIQLLCVDLSPEQAIDPIAWDKLGPELHYILGSEGILRSEPRQPVYYPGDTLRKSLIAKAKTIGERSSASFPVSTSVASSSDRNLWLTIIMPDHQRERLLLSDIEYRLFKTLHQAPMRHHEEELIKSSWDMPVSRTTLTQRIHHLRKKLRGVCGNEEIIQNHYGGFYSLNHPAWFELDR